MIALKVILTIGFAVLEIPFFINYYNVVNGTGEVKLAILIAGLIAQLVIYGIADNIAHDSWACSYPFLERKPYPEYLGNFIISIGFISVELFLVSCVLIRNQTLFIINLILMIINIITSTITIYRGVRIKLH